MYKQNDIFNWCKLSQWKTSIWSNIFPNTIHNLFQLSVLQTGLFRSYFMVLIFLFSTYAHNSISGVMVTVFASRMVARGPEPRSRQTIYYKISICCLSTKHTELKSRSKDWCTRNYTSQQKTIQRYKKTAMLKPKQLFIIMFAWNAFIFTKQTITPFSFTEKFRKDNFSSHGRVCDDRIRHLNHMRSFIVLWVWFNLEWLTRQLQITLICLE